MDKSPKFVRLDIGKASDNSYEKMDQFFANGAVLCTIARVLARV